MGQWQGSVNRRDIVPWVHRVVSKRKCRSTIPSLTYLEERSLLTATLLPTSTALTASSASVVSGQQLSLTAIVSPPPGSETPTGTVTFKDGSLTLGTAPLNGGEAVLPVSLSAVTVHRITASYAGDSQFTGSQTGDISTVAGIGTSGYSGDGNAATLAALNFPHGVTVDSSGNLYIADTNNHVVREVLKASGTILTIAGDGTAGFAGDGGPATDAMLNAPYATALDAAGNLYIADSDNNRIRELIKATGDIVTVAGNGTAGFAGDGAAAGDPSVELNNPRGLAVDASGDLFIADAFNNRVREIVAATGQIVTVAGTGAAGFNGDNIPATAAQLSAPRDVAVDLAGDLFIADTDNNRIREVVHSDGQIVTVAGDGTAGYTGDGGPATGAMLGSPLGIAVDASGNMFISDNDNELIREVFKATGRLITVAGNRYEAFSGDGGPAISASLNNPRGLALDASGNLYVADASNSAIRELKANVVSLNLDVQAPSPAPTPSLTPTVTILSASTLTTAYGQLVTYTASVQTSPNGAGTPTGIVVFLDGSSVIGSASLVGGQATLTTPIYGVGQTHSITAFYQGDRNDSGGTSAASQVTVAKADVEVVFAIDAIGRTGRRIRSYSLNVMLANHDGGLDPSSGIISYYANGHRFAKRRISTDQASLMVSARVLRGSKVTIKYSGNTDFNGASTQTFRITKRGIQPAARPLGGVVLSRFQHALRT